MEAGGGAELKDIKGFKDSWPSSTNGHRGKAESMVSKGRPDSR